MRKRFSFVSNSCMLHSWLGWAGLGRAKQDQTGRTQTLWAGTCSVFDLLVLRLEWSVVLCVSRLTEDVNMSADGSGEAGDCISAMKRRRLACSVPSPPANLEETPAKASDRLVRKLQLDQKPPVKLDQKSAAKLDQKSPAKVESATSRAMLTPPRLRVFSADDITKGLALDKLSKHIIANAVKISTPLSFRDVRAALSYILHSL